ncbi:unnamed protein product [Paramecium sonneborni]|uniref:Uncharacterized protein n=1 Tax=Paramecium sonneborni TaxID=65129 RepID=A0A8S1N4J9_9CILI|nr:unnamed protein product [Paramecium sonneborni]
MQKRPEDAKKEEQLFIYLQKSYADAQKGISNSMNKIIEEVCRKNKDIPQISLWVELFNRLLLQLQRNGNDAKMVIDIVLYKIPWFTSDNHFQVLPQFKKILFTILSMSPSQLVTIYRFLVQKLSLQMLIDSEQTRDDIPCEVMGQSFSSKAALQQQILVMTEAYQLTAENQIVKLSESHKQFIKEILIHHPKVDEKLKGMLDIGYGYFPSKNKSKCFYIIKKDNSYEDISYIKGIDGLYNDIYRDKYLKSSSNIHSDAAIQIICEIIQIYKLSKEKLLETLSDLFPHKNQSEIHQRVYATNCMKLSDRIPELRSRIFKMVYIKILQIDSEIKYDPQYNNFIIKTTLQQHLNKKHRDDMCKKVDHLLFILFDYLDSKLGIANKSIFQMEQNEDLIFKIFRELQSVFQEIMLKNQYYRMAHYVFLYFCSLPNSLQRINQLFLSQLVQNIRSNTLSKTEKINSLYYLSSLLVRCNSIKSTVFVKAVELLLEYLNDKSQQIEIELEHHLIQMMIFLISTKSTQLEILKNQIHETILKKSSTLQYIHYDILVKFNEVLLRSKSDDLRQKLIEITANTISKHIGNNCQGDLITNYHSPNTPQKLIYDHESLFSRTSTQRTVIHKNQLDFYQPFNSMTLIYSEPFIKEFYRYDQELIKDEGGSLNDSHVEEKRIPQFYEAEKPQKKVKQ